MPGRPPEHPTRGGVGRAHGAPPDVWRGHIAAGQRLAEAGRHGPAPPRRSVAPPCPRHRRRRGSRARRRLRSSPPPRPRPTSPAPATAPASTRSTVKGAERTRSPASTTSRPPARCGPGTPTRPTGPACTPPARATPSGVPGIQVDGYFPDTSTSNTNHGWNHDSQFVIRIPDAWNGKVVITGAPGVRGQYANDLVIGDWVLAQGYAFASTDKGNMGASFWDDGSTPGGSIREWHQRVTELAVATRDTVTKVRAHRPSRMYMAGISNGGYLTRWQLENRPDLYDGGLDWEGTLFRADGPNLFTYLPTALKHYPAYAATGDQAAHDAMIGAGFAAGSRVPVAVPLLGLLGRRPSAGTARRSTPTWDGDLKAGRPVLRQRHPALRRRLRLRLAPAGGQGRRALHRADRQDRQAARHDPRHPRHPAADRHRLRRLRPARRRAGRGGAAPLLPDRRRHPHRRARTPPSPTGCARCCRAPGPASGCSPTGSSGASSRRRTPPTRARAGTCSNTCAL